ncbi:Hypothetical predicted protein [Podarcis lilfordi]|uniref:Uncharacterized protein n=1 Tax=Podarcis lilfordi TaxID=74358 RepID=A0AA35PCF3_9SAUR|nr:Hypothetical predicted protein [Podarcis lilfordi]
MALETRRERNEAGASLRQRARAGAGRGRRLGREGRTSPGAEARRGRGRSGRAKGLGGKLTFYWESYLLATLSGAMTSAPGDDKVQASSVGQKKQSQLPCPISNLNSDEFVKIRRQCKEESFWYRGRSICF